MEQQMRICLPAAVSVCCSIMLLHRPAVELPAEGMQQQAAAHSKPWEQLRA